MISAPRIPPATKSDRLRSLLASCYQDPDRFARVILGCPPFDPAKNDSPFWYRQTQASRLVVSHHTTVLPWGNSLGKSWWLARGVVLWWLCTRPNSLVITTAPSHAQLNSVLWKNLRSAIDASRYPLGIRILKTPLTLELGPEWACLGITSNKGERLAGQHNPNLLVVVDEASGVEAETFHTIDGYGATKIVMIGNPLRVDGRFKESHDQALEQRLEKEISDDERTGTLSVPSTESPDAKLDISPHGMASGRWLRQMYRQYGEDSLWTRTHIKAQFPEASHDALIPEGWLQWAARTENKAARLTHPPGKTRIGADLGEGVGRDRTVIVVRDDLGVIEVWSGNGTDLDGAARIYAQLCTRHRVEQPHRYYDGLGIGRSFHNRLERHGIKATAYFGSGKGGKLYGNLRSACYWKLRQRLDPGHVVDPKSSIRVQPPFHIPAQAWWPAMCEELGQIRYELRGDRICLESKEDLMTRLGRSPDHADALAMTFMGEVARL